MRIRSNKILLTIAACVGLASTAEAAPMPIAGASHASHEMIETVQYYGGGYGYRGGYGYGYRHSPEHNYRLHIRRQMLHERRYDAHLRRQDQHYRRAYRYGY